MSRKSGLSRLIPRSGAQEGHRVTVFNFPNVGELPIGVAMKRTAQTALAARQNAEDIVLCCASPMKDHLPALALSQSTNELWGRLQSFSREIGCTGICFVDMARDGDPVVVRTTFTPQFFLRELRQNLTQTGSAIVIDCATMAFPAFGPRGLEGVLVVTMEEPATAEWTCARDLSAAFQLSYCRYRQLLPLERSKDVSLSDREREIMLWVMRGKSNAVIADIVGISTSTVDTYMRRIFKKLKVADRTSAAMRAIAVGAIG